MRFRIPGLANDVVDAHRGNATTTSSDVASSAPASISAEQANEKANVESAVVEKGAASDDEEDIDLNAQHGVQAMQGMLQVWSKQDMIMAYIMIWIVEFMLAFSNGITSTLTPYITSDFEAHSLTALTSVIAFLIAGLFKLPYAKIMDIWGRPQGLALMIVCMTLGAVMMAGCQNVTTYCAAQCFYWTGYYGIDFTVTVFIADTSKLRNRALMIAYTSSPYLITVWVYGYAAESVLDGMGFRWGFGIFCILFPVAFAPFAILMYVKQRKAEKMGLIPARVPRSLLELAREFDIVGLLILTWGLSLFLLAFNLYSYQADGWSSPMIICFLVFGFLLIVGFGVWEKFFAPVTFVPWHLLSNRTIIGTYTMVMSLYCGWYIWDSYFYSLLIVLFNQSVVNATYIGNIYTMGSCFICLVYGFFIAKVSGKIKMYSLFWGAPLTMLGVALMIVFRQPDVNIGYIVMCQIFVAFGGGVLVLSEQTTLMAVSKQQDFPALLAVESTIVSIAGSIGSTIAGAMWTGIFPARLAANLPASAQADLTSIYGSLTVQTSYAVGTPTRDAINLSYAETQRYMLIASTCIYSVLIVSVAMWQNVDLKKQKQRTHGML